MNFTLSILFILKLDYWMGLVDLVSVWVGLSFFFQRHSHLVFITECFCIFFNKDNVLKSWKVETTSQDDFDWVVLLKYLLSSSGAKSLGLQVGFTWQRRCSLLQNRALEKILVHGPMAVLRFASKLVLQIPRTVEAVSEPLAMISHRKWFT